MCVNQHAPSYTVTRPDGRVVCTACAEFYSIPTRAASAESATTRKARRNARSATTAGRPNDAHHQR